MYFPWFSSVDDGLIGTTQPHAPLEKIGNKIRTWQQTWIEFEHLHNNVVDGDVDQLDKETNEAHDGKANGSGHSNLLELCTGKKLKVGQSHIEYPL